MKMLLLLFCPIAILSTAFNMPPTDYRDAYVGTYRCNSKCQVLNSDYTELSYRTDVVAVTITKNSRDSIMDISLSGRVFEVKLRNGKMHFSEKGVRTYGRFFSTDSIAFSTSSGLGPNECSYRGKKQ